jgi:hypothetical protein
LGLNVKVVVALTVTGELAIGTALPTLVKVEAPIGLLST